jgi:hypothetical protein
MIKQLLSTHRRGMKMRPLVIIGLILAVLGLIALAVPSFTYFTTERVADVGFFKLDISRPHTIVFHPIVGGITMIAGIVLILMGFRTGSS